MSELREVLYVLDDGPVGWGSIQGNENLVVHGTSMYSASKGILSEPECPQRCHPDGVRGGEIGITGGPSENPPFDFAQGRLREKQPEVRHPVD